MSGWLWVPVIWMVLAAVASASSVGKPRQPMTGGVAALTMLFALGLAFCILKGGGAL